MFSKYYLLSLPFPIEFLKMEGKKNLGENRFSKLIATLTDDNYSAINTCECCVMVNLGQMRQRQAKLRGQGLCQYFQRVRAQSKAS